MAAAPTIVWFRQDLRLADNPALRAAADAGGPVIPVYLWAPEDEGDWPPGGAAKVWLHRSLESLEQALGSKGSRLILRRGPALETLRSLIRETGAQAVFWNRRYEPASIRRDKQVKKQLDGDGLDVKSFKAGLLWEPWEVQTQSGAAYKVYTPYWRALQELEEPADPLPEPAKLPAPAEWPSSDDLGSLDLLPNIRWDRGIRDFWSPGEDGARQLLDRFLQESVSVYKERRNRPDVRGTSELSPYLHHGEISPRQVWKAVRNAIPQDRRATAAKNGWTFLGEIGWREFGYHLLYHFPHTPDQPLYEQYKSFPWANDFGSRLKKWRKGRTGFPIVDAGMRQLWEIGWMHNRVRMIVASFLVKDLLIPWQEGARWFWDTLVDADLASNTLGWQWAAGCGADAAPYFRVFNPMTQGEKFDPQGDYTRRWVPELSKLAAKRLQEPWKASAEELERAELRLGDGYPEPLVDHGDARKRALQAYELVKKKR